MQKYQKDFINFMLNANALNFGDFTLKSGRKSPFFMNAGSFVTGSALSQLGNFYAQAIAENFGDDFDVLFGPAYKGIPLAVATAIAFHNLYKKDVRYVSNRKEIKDHGDAGILLGSPLQDGDRVVIVEDVTTSGASMAETVPILRAQGNIEILGEIVMLDRQERGQKTMSSALSEITATYGFPARAIVTMSDVIEVCRSNGIIDDNLQKAIDEYYAQYGAK